MRVSRAIHDDYIVLHYRRDMSTKQIAKKLGIPRGSVIRRYHIAKGNRVGAEYFPTGEGNHRRRYKNGRFRYE